MFIHRKRRLRNVDKEEPVEEEIDSLDVVKNEENIEGAQSRLAGRVGTRGEVGGSRKRDAEDETDKPKLKAGRDLRDLLNRDVSAIQHDPGYKLLYLRIFSSCCLFFMTISVLRFSIEYILSYSRCYTHIRSLTHRSLTHSLTHAHTHVRTHLIHKYVLILCNKNNEQCIHVLQLF